MILLSQLTFYNSQSVLVVSHLLFVLFVCLHSYYQRVHRPASLTLLVQMEAVVYLENGLTQNHLILTTFTPVGSSTTPNMTSLTTSGRKRERQNSRKCRLRRLWAEFQCCGVLPPHQLVGFLFLNMLQSPKDNYNTAMCRLHLKNEACDCSLHHATISICIINGSSSIGSPLTHTVYLLPFLDYLAGSKSISARPSDPDTISHTTLEAIASRSDKKSHQNVYDASTTQFQSLGLEV